MSVVYSTITLTDPSPFDIEWPVIINDVLLISGKHSVQSSTETALRVTFKCQTANMSEITGLKGLIGAAYTLAIDGTSYTKCYISNFSFVEVMPGLYSYTVSFIQDTT